MGSFYERLESRNNALSFLRLVLAGLVIVSHAAPIAGFGEELRLGGMTLGNFAVGGFFAISGYLITASRVNSALFPYIWRRFLRIFPGYWGCLVVVGLLFSGLAGTFRDGWSIQNALGYVASNWLMVFKGDAFTETLNGAPFSWSWNGSLWTLRYELLCYVGVGLAFLIPKLRRSRVIFALCLAGCTAYSVPVDILNVAGPLADMGFLLPFFVAGAFLFRYSRNVPATGPLAAVAAATLLVVISLGLGKSLSALPVAYLCLWLAVALPDTFRRFGRRNDVSYGLYLYGFPVQQMLVLVGAHQLGLTWFTLLSLIATFPMAVASWFLVERPAMEFKSLVRNRRTGIAS